MRTDKPVACDSCDTRLETSSLSGLDYQALKDRVYLGNILGEIKFLLRVRDFFQRNPGAEQKYKPAFLTIIESKDPKVREALSSDIPFSIIEKTTNLLPNVNEKEPEGDGDIIEFLQYNSFSLPHRLQSLCEDATRFARDARKVICPTCKIGTLFLDIEIWKDDGPSDGWISYAR